MNPVTEAGAVLVPPRPNPGPEPMDRGPSPSGLAFLMLLVVAAASLNLLLYRRLFRRDRPRADCVTIAEGPFASRREQMAAWSAAVRAALARRFGEQWPARTTEEIVGDAPLIEKLGPELATQLARFLAEADRAKFDDREGLQPPLPGTLPERLAGFVASSVPAAGARSRIKGK